MEIPSNSPNARNGQKTKNETPRVIRGKGSGVAPPGFNAREFEANFDRQWAAQGGHRADAIRHHHFYCGCSPQAPATGAAPTASRTPSQSPPKTAVVPVKKTEPAPAPKPAVSSNGRATYNPAMGMFINDSEYSEQLGYSLVDELFGKSPKK